MSTAQRLYLEAMGIQLWERRALPPVVDGRGGEGGAGEEVQRPVAETAQPKASRASPPVIPVAASGRATAPVVDDAIPAWLDEAPPPEESPYAMAEGEYDLADFIPGHAVPAAPALPLEPALPAIATLGWPALAQRVAGCSGCPALAEGCPPLFGAGNQTADWLLIGAAPTADEAQQGEPFTGQEGVLLGAMLRALGLTREQVYLTNIVKCATPAHREPTAQEAEACAPYLQRQIALVQPRVILLLGRVAAQTLLQCDTPIGKLRGTVHRHEGGASMVATYHPAYLLRSPLEKRQAWADLLLARAAAGTGGA
jgi:uracil-DNA glycosylase family 4